MSRARSAIERAQEQRRRESLFRDREGRWPMKAEAEHLDYAGRDDRTQPAEEEELPFD